MESNKIQEFIEYLKQNNQQDSISDYFTKYAAAESITPTITEQPKSNFSSAFKTQTPIISNNTTSNTPVSNKISIKAPKVETTTPVVDNNTKTGQVNSTGTSTGTGTSFKNRQEFINAITPAVQKVAAELGIDPNIIIGQVAAEQGFKNTKNVRNANNIFNITSGSSWKGPVYISEDQNEKGEVVMHKFRKYATIEDSIRDWAELMKRKYPKSLAAAKVSPEEFFKIHAWSGYAEGVGTTKQEAKNKLYNLYKNTYKKYV
jgi:flagellum-specific peptidoglycan hydrolase FlgJ